MPLFGAAYAAPNKASQFYIDLGLENTVEMVKIKDFSRPLSVLQLLFKANLIFKYFSRHSCVFKYFSSPCKPCTRPVAYFSHLIKVLINLLIH